MEPRGKNETNGERGGLYINISDGITDGYLLLSVALNSIGNTIGN
jgi:hypothetical protein